ncbi:MAG: methyltransferase domain-containing protein [Planctomycetota bacterium]|nr:methyltransferase domain-containing protein [Planctomycetota bacterium]
MSEVTPQDARSVDILDAVRERYAQGARDKVPELCCPVDYDTSLLQVLPDEIIERDYGCGDPSRFVREGNVVLDLGSGAGKICFMASQLVGPEGRVIGVDATDEMLALARKWRPVVAQRIGWDNVEFRHGYIQDLRLDRDRLQAFLDANPVGNLADLEGLHREETRLRTEQPLVPDESVDLVISNCVLNLVENGSKRLLFEEIHRVLKRGGRCAISDIVSDEDVPPEMQADSELWTGCISGAMREDRFLEAFAGAGLYGVELVSWQTEPWAIVQGIEFRSITVVAHKGKEGACWEHNDAVVYNGPWKQVVDDDGHVFRRGDRTAVCRKTFGIMTSEPYGASMTRVPPLEEIAAEDARPFDCEGTRRRDASETKYGVIREDVTPSEDCCEPGGSCG